MSVLRYSGRGETSVEGEVMRISHIVLIAAVALGVSLGVLPQACGNLLTNPGLETGDLTGWATFGQGWRVTAWGPDIHSGTNAVVNDVTSSDVDEWRGIFQNVAAQSGMRYDAEVWIRTQGIEDSRSWLEIQFLDVTNGVIQQFQTSLMTNDQSFTSMSIGSMIAPVGSVTACVRGVVQMVTAPGDTDYHIFDDFSLIETIPEPSTVGLLLCGCAGLFLRRRRTKRD